MTAQASQELENQIENVYLTVINDQALHKSVHASIARLYAAEPGCMDGYTRIFLSGDYVQKTEFADITETLDRAHTSNAFGTRIRNFQHVRRVAIGRLLQHFRDEFVPPTSGVVYIDTTTPTPKEFSMNNVKIETKTFITLPDGTGDEARHLSAATLIDAIENTESEIARLSAIKAKSTKITSRIEELNAYVTGLVAELDSR